MGAEYVMYYLEEYKNLRKNLLTSEISNLNFLQAMENYKKFRDEELRLKIQLKTLINQAQENLDLFQNLLPETSFKEEENDTFQISQTPQSEQATAPVQTNKSNQLQAELDEIRRKLALLQ